MFSPFELKPYLFPRGRAGLACDVEGVALGPVNIVEKSNLVPGKRYRICPPEVFAEAFITAYGKPPLDMLVYLWQGIGRVRKSLEDGDVALAVMKAIHLKFPEIEPEYMAKLAASKLAKAGYNPDEPRDERGRWTSDGPAGESFRDSSGLAGRQFAQADTGIMNDASPGNSGPIERQPNKTSHHDGAPLNRFSRDFSGNLVYSNEVYNGPFSNNDAALHVSDAYGVPRDGGNTLHAGIDLATGEKTGIKMRSLTDGTVIQVGATGFGPSSVTIKSSNDTYFTYGHLNSNSVNVGDRVSAGQFIGEIGNKGHSSGIHVHIQASKGAAFGSKSRMLGIKFPR